jgi:glycosyltransferase involved in cell wall biosynthesis
MPPRIVYWNNIPAPYMVERFNALARRANVDLEVWFSMRREKDRSWKVDETAWEFQYRYLPQITVRNPVALPAPLVRGQIPDILVSLYAASSFMLGWAIARARGARTAFWVEVTFDAWVTRRRWKESAKSLVLPRADGILTAGRDGREFAMRYGVSADRVFIVPHVIDFDHYARGSSAARSSRERVRAELGVRGVTFIYVGRLWLGKGLQYLLDAFGTLQRTTAREVSLLIVGDGVDEGLLRARCREQRLANVVFTGFHEADSLPRLYAAADVFVFPTLGDPFGMVVPEAMACGLPVIATSASGEIGDRVTDGVNGYIVPPADGGTLCERMARLVDDGALRKQMGEAAREKVAGQTPDVWAKAFEHAIDAILTMPRTADAG